jgi:hypothetical protein
MSNATDTFLWGASNASRFSWLSFDCPEETRPQDLNDYLYGQQHIDS